MTVPAYEVPVYDVIIVGAGPAGIFSAIELVRAGVTNILIAEKGHAISKRRCPARRTSCVGCRTCDIMTGWGGAGAFSDGKLTLTTEVGGWLGDYVEHGELQRLIDYADKIWCEFGAPPEVHAPDPEIAPGLERDAVLAGMHLVPMRIRHMGTDRSPQILEAMRSYLAEAGVTIRTECPVTRILASNGQVVGVELDDGEVAFSANVVVAPGREGADWLAAQCRELGIVLTNNAVDIGVRVECPAPVMERLTDALYEAKLVYHTKSFGDAVRTFCMNPYGEVTTECYGDVVTVNGHSYSEARTPFTNFAVLVSQRFTEPFKDPITYGRSIAKLANLLGAGILVQRFADLKAGRRSTPVRMAQSLTVPTLGHATPGDLSAVLPYRHLTDIMEFLEALEALVPGIAGPNTLLYGVELKFYSSRVEVSQTLETPVGGLYAVGDGAGMTRGLAQSSASGILAARAVLARRDG
ncbi:MAG: NAD(P)/FAD-dependent oxidoreductase [Coriobacteriia bacterium]